MAWQMHDLRGTVDSYSQECLAHLIESYMNATFFT